MDISLLMLISFTTVSIIAAIKYVLRQRFPVGVSCWFCGENAKVPYDSRNSWDCVNCEQYNGFDKDGGYNKPIAAQYDDRLNRPIRCEEEEFIVGGNIMCKRCTQNQEIKIKQFANFTPFNERNYDEEFAAFKRHTERVLSLCPICEVKVHEVIKSQDDELMRRRSHLEDSSSFMSHDVPAEQTYLHSSYMDTYYNMSLVTSIILHSVSLVFSILLVTKEINLDGNQAWQKHLLFLHPVLLWLDKNADVLAMLGLTSFFGAKLFLGKCRLYKIDVISCLVWILATLSQTGIVLLYETGSVYHFSGLVLNCLTSAVCVGIYRRRTDRPNISMIKMNMENSFSGPGETSPPYSALNQVDDSSSRSLGQPTEAEARSYDQVSKVNVKMSHDQRSEGEIRSQVTSTTDPEVSEPKVSQANNKEPLAVVDSSGQGQGQKGLIGNIDLGHTMANNFVDQTTTALNAFSLGTPSMRKNDSGFSSILSQENYASNLSQHSVSENLRSRKQGRSLLSQPKFTHESNPNKHRMTPVPMYGLFTVPATDTPSTSFMDRPDSPIRTSAFTPTCLFSSDRHSFTPERPISPVTTSFGERPFLNMPLRSDSPSRFSSSIPIVKSSQDDMTCGFRPIAHVARQPRSATKIIDDTDSEDGCSSGITTHSKTYFDKNSADSNSTHEKQVAWWVPGLVGFALGGSVVGNIVQVLMSRSTQ